MAGEYPNPEQISKALMDEVSKQLNLYAKGPFSHPETHSDEHLVFNVPGTESTASIEIWQEGYGEIVEADGNRYNVMSVSAVVHTPALIGVHTAATEMFHRMALAVTEANEKHAGLASTLAHDVKSINYERSQIRLVQKIATLKSFPWSGKAPEGTESMKVVYLDRIFECTVENGKLTIKEVD